MKLRSSELRRSTKRRLLLSEHAGQRGIVIVLFAIVTVVLLLGAGLAVDLGLAHVTMSRLSKAVDAGALSGARHASEVLADVKDLAERVAAANYGAIEEAGANYAVTVSRPSTDTYTVNVRGETGSPTFMMRLIGRTSVDVAAVAEATRNPLDLSLVLYLSGSLEDAGVFDDMQRASKGFLDHFHDTIDQVGIVAYSTWAWDAMSLRKNFKATGRALIDSFEPLKWTNIEEGLRLGKAQMDTGPQREKALKIVVLFTDGRPTAFADVLRMDGPAQDCATADDVAPVTSPDSDGDGIPDCFGGVVAGTGLWRANDGMKVIRFQTGQPVLAPHNSSQNSIHRPTRLPGGRKVSTSNIEAVGYIQAEEWANRIRAAGYTIYCVGLGNPNAPDPSETPDLDFLRRVANDKGIVNAGQPIGEMLFAPSAAELHDTFTRLADRILTRLTR
jgi:Flp pilus assembly protein TadG